MLWNIKSNKTYWTLNKLILNYKVNINEFLYNGFGCKCKVYIPLCDGFMNYMLCFHENISNVTFTTQYKVNIMYYSFMSYVLWFHRNRIHIPYHNLMYICPIYDSISWFYDMYVWDRIHILWLGWNFM